MKMNFIYQLESSLIGYDPYVRLKDCEIESLVFIFK